MASLSSARRQPIRPIANQNVEFFLSDHLLAFLELEECYFQSSFMKSFDEHGECSEGNELAAQVLLRCGYLHRSVWSYFHAIDVRTCAPQLTRNRGFRGDSGNTINDGGLNTLMVARRMNQQTQTSAVLSETEELAYIKAMKCSQFPLQPLLNNLNLNPTSIPSRPHSSASGGSFNGNPIKTINLSRHMSSSSGINSPTLNQNSATEKDRHASGTDESVLAERELSFYIQEIDPRPEVVRKVSKNEPLSNAIVNFLAPAPLNVPASNNAIPSATRPLPFLEHLHRAFRLSASLIRHLATRIPVNYNQRVQNLIEDFQVRLKALECNQLDLYSPKDFIYPPAYDKWRIQEDAVLRGILQNLHGGRLQHASGSTYHNSVAEYDILFQRLLEHDISTSLIPQENFPLNCSLSPISQFILQEFRLRYCISDVYANVLHLQHLLCESYFQLNTSHLKQIEELASSVWKCVNVVTPQDRLVTSWEMDYVKRVLMDLDRVIRCNNVERDAFFYFSETTKESDKGGLDCLLSLMCIIYQLKNCLGMLVMPHPSKAAFIEASVKRACFVLYEKVYANITRASGQAPNEMDLSYLIDFFVDKANKMGTALEPHLGRSIIISIRQSLYARLMEAVVLYFDERYMQGLDQPSVHREEMALIHQLNGLDAAWSSDIDHSCHLWRRQAFKLSSLWLKELERSCKKFMRASLMGCDFRLQKLYLCINIVGNENWPPSMRVTSRMTATGHPLEADDNSVFKGATVFPTGGSGRLSPSKNSAFFRSPRRRQRGTRGTMTVSAEDEFANFSLNMPASSQAHVDNEEDIDCFDSKHPPRISRHMSEFLLPVTHEETEPQHTTENLFDCPIENHFDEPLLLQTVQGTSTVLSTSWQEPHTNKAGISADGLLPSPIAPFSSSHDMSSPEYRLVVHSSSLIDFFCILRRFVATAVSIKYLLTNGGLTPTRSVNPRLRRHSSNAIISNEKVLFMRDLWQAFLKREMEVFLCLVRTFCHNLIWMDLCSTPEELAKTLFHEECLNDLLRSNKKNEIWGCRHKGKCVLYTRSSSQWCPRNALENIELPSISILIRLNDVLSVRDMVNTILLHHFAFCRMGDTIGSDYRNELEKSVRIFLNGIIDGHYQLCIYKFLQPIESAMDLLPMLSSHPTLTLNCVNACQLALHKLFLLFQRFLPSQFRPPAFRIVQSRIYSKLMDLLTSEDYDFNRSLALAASHICQTVKRFYSHDNDSVDVSNLHMKLTVLLDLLLKTAPFHIGGACLLLSNFHPILPSIDYLNEFQRHVFATVSSNAFSKSLFRRYFSRNPMETLSSDAAHQSVEEILANLEAVCVLKPSDTPSMAFDNWTSDDDDGCSAPGVPSMSSHELFTLSLPKSLSEEIACGMITDKNFNSISSSVSLELCLRMDTHIISLARHCQSQNISLKLLMSVLLHRKKSNQNYKTTLNFLLKYSSERDPLQLLASSICGFDIRSSCSIS